VRKIGGSLNTLGKRSSSFLAVLLYLTAAAQAQPVMTYIYHSPESALDVRYVYHWEILRTALEKTSATWGPYRMVPSAFMTERRQAFELKNATGTLTVMYLSTTPDFERSLIPIRIPVDRNLGGYCVFLIRKEDQRRFDSVRTIDDLRRFTFGLGLGWEDVDILRNAGLRVVTGSSYDGLFEMLVNKRFDVLPRATVEVLDEYDRRAKELPDLWIEQHLLLYYPLPMYFWFPKTPEGRRLASRAEEGMRIMIADGTYDQIFDKYQRRKIQRLQLTSRTMIRIGNPFLGPEVPFSDKRLWFDPQTWK
jgi:ABC-type amino acid transport substrate-binding protein